MRSTLPLVESAANTLSLVKHVSCGLITTANNLLLLHHSVAQDHGLYETLINVLLNVIADTSQKQKTAHIRLLIKFFDQKPLYYPLKSKNAYIQYF